MKKLIVLATAVVGASMALAVGLAYGDIFITTYPGLKCVERNDTTPEIYYSGGNAYNDANGSNSFACPTNNRYVDFGQGGNYMEETLWWAYVDDRNSSTNVSCYLRSCNQDGTSCINSSTVASSGTGIQQISGSTLGARPYTNYVYLSCSVPGKSNGIRSGIKSYTAYEF